MQTRSAWSALPAPRYLIGATVPKGCTRCICHAIARAANGSFVALWNKQHSKRAHAEVVRGNAHHAACRAQHMQHAACSMQAKLQPNPSGTHRGGRDVHEELGVHQEDAERRLEKRSLVFAIAHARARAPTRARTPCPCGRTQQWFCHRRETSWKGKAGGAQRAGCKATCEWQQP